nr:hypothetical protein [Tanacetum cinerariifolium]GEY76236.1 hypothetical protein [Tanacetum cinerariifolium]
MASLDYHLNPIYTIKECSFCGDLYNKLRGCFKGGFVDKFVCDLNKTPDSSLRPPHNCPKCGNPVDGLYCRQCALLRKKLKEVWFTICDENEIFQDFLNTSKSSNDNTNVVDAPQEPFVFNQDPGENSLQSPPHIDHHCCYGFPIISNPEPCYNQNVDEFPQTLPSFHPTCYSEDENSFTYDSKLNFVDDSPNPPPQPPTNSHEFCGNDAHYSHDFSRHSSTSSSNEYGYLQYQENIINSVQTFLREFNHFSFFETPKVLLLAWDRVFKIKDAFGNKQYKPEDIQELIQKLFNDVQNIYEELTEYINTPSWNRPIVYYDDDDDEDYTIAITPVLLTEEPVDSLIMDDEHLDTIPTTESDKVIKSSVEDLVPIPSESEGIFDDTCDVPFCDNSPPLYVLNDHFEIFSDFKDDCASSDDDSFEDIDYVEASPLDSELVSLEEAEDDILHEKLLKIHFLISKIESLNDNLTTDRVLKSPSLFPIPVEDSDSFFEKFDTSLSYSDNSLPEFETFSNHTEETSSGNQGELTSIVMEDNLGEPQVHVPNVLPTHPTLMLDSDFIPSDDSLGSDFEVSFPSGTRNKIFDPGIFFEVESKIFLS